jgi:O-methyltransferase
LQRRETQERARASFASARDPHARGAGEDAESLRVAYLDLLKLGLCDLIGTTSVSSGRTAEGTVEDRVISGDDRRWRAAGMDWPRHGLTMVGLARLDDLQACVETVVKDGIEGDLIEAGSWRGGAALLMRATLDSLGAGDRSVAIADSFQGFPAPEATDDGDVGDLSMFDFLAVPVDEVRATFERLGYASGVEFVPGFFADTMPTLPARPWAVARFDVDAYDATRLALEAICPHVSPGGYVIIDDYGAYDECRRAVDDYRTARGIDAPLEEVDWTGVRWRRPMGQSV